MSSNKRSRPQRAAAPHDTGSTSPRRRIVDAHEERPDSRATPPLFTAEPNWWSTTSEWLRGKSELVWDSAVLPVLGWLGHITERIGLGRRVRRISQRTVRNTGELRTWNDAGAGMIKRVSRILMIAAISAALLVVVSALAVRAVGALSNIQPNISLGGGSSSSTATPPGAITIRNGGNSGTPVGIPNDTLGMWMSNNSPSSGEQITVYAKVARLSAPVPNIKVSFNIGGNTASVTTDQDGIAAWKISGNGPGSVPVAVNGAVTVDGQNLTATTFYTPI